LLEQRYVTGRMPFLLPN